MRGCKIEFAHKGWLSTGNEPYSLSVTSLRVQSCKWCVLNPGWLSYLFAYFSRSNRNVLESKLYCVSISTIQIQGLRIKNTVLQGMENKSLYNRINEVIYRVNTIVLRIYDYFMIILPKGFGSSIVRVCEQQYLQSHLVTYHWEDIFYLQIMTSQSQLKPKTQ